MRALLGLLKFPRLRSALARRPAGPKPRELMTDSDWVRHRAPKRHRDESLSEAAQRWFQRLPPEARPNRLCAAFPRIVNRLAFLWRDPGLTEHYLEELLVPRRSGRQGFPADVSAELAALLLRNEQRLYVTEDAAEA